MDVTELAQFIRTFLAEQQKIAIVRRRRAVLVRRSKRNLENNLTALDGKD